IFPRTTLASDVVTHMALEPQAWAVTDRTVSPEALQKILAKSGVRLSSSIGPVTYANTCLFRGHTIPHLVIQDERGPVTILLLPDETVRAEMRFAEKGYSGVIVPAPRGSIAVLSRDQGRVDAIAARVLGAER